MKYTVISFSYHCIYAQSVVDPMGIIRAGSRLDFSKYIFFIQTVSYVFLAAE